MGLHVWIALKFMEMGQKHICENNFENVSRNNGKKHEAEGIKKP